MAEAKDKRAAARTARTPETGETHERIFLAAERLFAERGFEGVSVRDIVQEAGVNLAAVSYHFGSKSALLLGIFRRRAKEMNRERLALLRDAEIAFAGAPPLRELLRAILGPPILWRDPASGKDTASRFLSRAMAEVTPDLRKILESDVSHLRAFLGPLKRALPGMSEAELCWALHFAVGAPHQRTDTNFKRIKTLSDGACDTNDLALVLERAIRFTAGGVEAMALNTAARRKSCAG